MRSWPKVIAVLGCLAAAGCGAGYNNRHLGITNIPLAPGARIADRVRVCDRGANAFCSEQVVVVGDRYASSADLLNSENRRLHQLGWTVSRGDTGKQLAAESPGHELRMTFNTAYNDLIAVDQGWIQRAAATGRALSAALFDRASAISLMLERGTS